jgi:hypothetical protein
MVLSPKRDEAGKLGEEITELEASVAAAEDSAAVAAEAEEGYGENYHRLVVLGKAVPEDANTSSLLVELQELADASKVDFRSISLSENAGAADAGAVATPPPLTAPTTPSGEAPAEGSTAPEATPTSSTSEPTAGASTATTDSAAPAPTESTATSTTTTAATPPADPTEASAAMLPIGATVGAAGLPVMPYELGFSGGFFEIADFFASVDDLIRPSDVGVGVRGRLLTIDGFNLAPVSETSDVDAPAGSASSPPLEVALATTSYVTPAEQGLVAGATPGAPPATSATTTPTSSTTTTPTPAPTP